VHQDPRDWLDPSTVTCWRLRAVLCAKLLPLLRLQVCLLHVLLLLLLPWSSVHHLPLLMHVPLLLLPLLLLLLGKCLLSVALVLVLGVISICCSAALPAYSSRSVVHSSCTP
jgi:hypothetical protein